MLLVLASGTYLQFEEVAGLARQPEAPPAGGGAPAAPASPEQIAAQLDAALGAARKAEPDFVPRRIELNITPGREVTRLAMQPRGGPFVEIDHATGKVRAEMEPQTPLHVIFIRLHTGSMLGPVGILGMFASSLVLLFLAVSGGVLYWQMWRNRAARGRGALFWK